MALTLSGPASAGLLVSIVTAVPAAITATAIPRTRYLQARQTTNDLLTRRLTPQDVTALQMSPSRARCRVGMWPAPECWGACALGDWGCLRRAGGRNHASDHEPGRARGVSGRGARRGAERGQGRSRRAVGCPGLVLLSAGRPVECEHEAGEAPSGR